MIRHHRPTRTPAGNGCHRPAWRRLAVEPLETRALLAAFPLPLMPLGPAGSLIYTGSVLDLHGVDGPSETFDSGELAPNWTATSSQAGAQIRVTGEAGTGGGDNALIMGYDGQGSPVESAQDIDAAGWSRTASGDILSAQARPHVTIEGTGDDTFDYYRFTVAGPGDVGTFDIDHTNALDAHLRLYDSAGNVIAANDDSSTSSGAGGSQTGLDSFLQYTFRAAGEYVIEVGRCCVSPVSPGGSYTLQVSLDDHPVQDDAEPIAEVEPNQPGGNLNEAVWTVDLEGVPEALLRFSYANFGDELDFFMGDFEGSAPADGAAISDDGVRWHPIFTPFQGFGVWQEHVVDLHAEAAAAGMQLGPGFQIKFQQFGDEGARGWDEIALVVPGEDTDSYEIAVEPGQLLTFEAVPMTGSLQPVIDVYAVSGDTEELRGTATADASGEAAILQTLATGPGVQTYRIDVRGAAGVGTYGVRLFLNAALEEEARGRGDNSTRQTAQALEPSQIDVPPASSTPRALRGAVVGLLEDGPAGPDDYYSLALQAGDTATANLTFLDGGAAELMLLDSDGQTLATSGSTVATNVDRAIAGFVAPATGTYYIRVTGDEQAAYTLLVTQNAEFEQEGNSTFEDAQAVPGPLGGRGHWIVASRTPAEDFPSVAEVEPNDPQGSLSLDGAQNIDESGWTRVDDDNIAESETRPHVSILGTGNNTFDYYRFTVASAGDVGVFDIDATSSMDSYLRLYNASGNELARSDDSNTSDGAAGSDSNLDSYIQFTFPAPGEYVIEVGTCCGPEPVESGGRYTLHISLDNHPLTYDIRPVRDIEPNEPPPPDLLEVAHDIDAATWSIAYDENVANSSTLPHVSIVGSGDGTFDYYSFSVESANSIGFLDIDLENFNTHLFLYDSQGNLLAENNDDGGDPGSRTGLDSYITHRFSSPGTYVVGVARFFSSDAGGQISGTPPQNGDSYTLHVSLQDRPRLPASDLYSVELNADQQVIVETFTPSPLPGEFANQLDPLVRIYDGQGNVLATDDNSAADGRNASLAFLVPTTGTYLVEVTALDPASEGEYLLNIREDRLEGDYDGDGMVAESDLDLVLTHWGNPPERLPPEWINDVPSSIVDQTELDAVLGNWGHTSQPLAVGSPTPVPAALSYTDAECRSLPLAARHSAIEDAFGPLHTRPRTFQDGSTVAVTSATPPREPAATKPDDREAADAFSVLSKLRSEAINEIPRDRVLEILFARADRNI